MIPFPDHVPPFGAPNPANEISLGLSQNVTSCAFTTGKGLTVTVFVTELSQPVTGLA